jgi:hypothetical protein
MSKTIEVDFGLSDLVRFKDDLERTGFIVCIYVQWPGITYLVCEPNGEMVQVTAEEIEVRS